MKTIARSLILFTCALRIQAQMMWINELHYDNAGADNGEFVEVAVPSGETTLSSISITLYNGTGGVVYGTHALSSFAAGETAGGYTFYFKWIPGIQNETDGVALDRDGTVLQFLSYEGVVTAQAGIASGRNSTDIGVAESNSSTVAGSSLGLVGVGQSYSDLSWAVLSAASPGGLNGGETISAVPEPGLLGALTALGLAVFAIWMRLDGPRRLGRDRLVRGRRLSI